MKKTKNLLLLLVTSALVAFTTACGGGDEATGSELEGSVVVDGSGTVFPLMAKLAEDYMVNEQENVSVEVGRSGTSAGFKKFLVEGGTDFNNASRHMKDEEKATAEELGLSVKELKVALDGITMVINKENTWATELTQQEIIDIFLATGGKKNWSDVRPEFPNQPITTYGPNENHGTYEFFFETIMEEKELIDTINLQQDYSTLVDLVSKDVNAIGFFGYGYYANNQDKLTAINIDFGNGPVEPTLETIKENGAYAPFTRPVYTYLNEDNAKANPQVLDFAIYVMNNADQAAEETGFAPLTEAELTEQAEYLEGLK
ncbi:PstS family phosphate ABC transporter substrate-binding protein [Litchfieldia alkalitelluris]|uniref:PstS family phosphate ABC transporter substrate-binding protein n=1 Tax=Litchfieldia alkalitelluris TaxID=304268 RepID=UPI0009961048|nr:PstS family phosphate ABC transporter substrate-binding protein [Litchfieldia alkalitelluris]